MGKRFDGKLCILCGAMPSTPAGEHIWPRWFLDDVGGDGPFTMHIGDSPTRKRKFPDGSPGDIRTQTSLMGSRAPMCADCNGHLNTRFEAPAKSIVRRLVPLTASHQWPVLNADEAAAVALWLIKIGLLLKHPDTRHDDPDQDRMAERWPAVESKLFSWMADGSPPPNGLSLYLTRRDETADPEPTRRVPLPTVRIGSDTISFVSTGFGIRGIDVDLVYHPGWPLDHALVAERRAALMWPHPQGIDVGALPGVHPRHFGFLADGFVEFREGQFPSSDLAPLSHDTDLGALVQSGQAIAAAH